jgi:hypothetical protein
VYFEDTTKMFPKVVAPIYTTTGQIEKFLLQHVHKAPPLVFTEFKFLRAGDVAQVVDHLPNKFKALTS